MVVRVGSYQPSAGLQTQAIPRALPFSRSILLTLLLGCLILVLLDDLSLRCSSSLRLFDDILESFLDLRLAVIHDLRVCLINLGEVAGDIGRLISVGAGRSGVLGIYVSGGVVFCPDGVRLDTNRDV